jgi:hypothetical protein
MIEGYSSGEYITFVPFQNGKEMKEAAISFREDSLLLMFLYAVIEDYDEYENVSIPWDKWKTVLHKWKLLSDADDYDSMLEALVGINYDSWYVDDENLMTRFGRNGLQYWNQRLEEKESLLYLLDWTNRYEGISENLVSYGY